MSADSAWPPLFTRAAELTPEVRRIIARFRAELRAHLPGETVKVYIPRGDTEQLARQRAEQRRRILAALARREPPSAIAAREGVTERFVRKLRGTIGGGTLPP